MSFLRQFIETESYLQNPPMTADNFINYCKKCGVRTTKKELELFERKRLLVPILRIDRPNGVYEKTTYIDSDGKKKWTDRPYNLKEGEKLVDRRDVRFYLTYDLFKEDVLGSTYFRDSLIELVESGALYDPLSKSFQPWENFLGEELDHDRRKIVSFYSNFQILILESLQIFKCEDLPSWLNDNKLFEFLLLIQSVYYPYARSGGGRIQSSISQKKCRELRRQIDLSQILAELGLEMSDVASWYKKLSSASERILGSKYGDWAQLWKNIGWKKKDKLKGKVRLGVEYLQWALMLKRVIEEYVDHSILDVDEMGNTSANDVLRFDPNASEQTGFSLRSFRSKHYADESGDLYHGRRKRLFYLANDFGLDYQPRVIVFVEGETEEGVLPGVFERYTGHKPQNLGVEFVNFRGVTKLISTSKDAEKLKTILCEIEKEMKQATLSKNKHRQLNKLIRSLSNTDIIISNWTSFLSYNLQKWQTIPFFLSDNEGNVKAFLDAGRPIRFEGKQYNIPKDWQHVWGDENEGSGFAGKDFELVNFNDLEIAQALTDLLTEQVSPDLVNEYRLSGKGITQILKLYNSEVRKTAIADRLFNNLFEQYAASEDPQLFTRPIFTVMGNIADMANLNHPPVDRVGELKNQAYIKQMLEGAI